MHIYLRAAVSVAGEQNPTYESDVLAVDYDGVFFCLFVYLFISFFPVSVDVGYAALLAGVPLPGMMHTVHHC